MTDESMEHLQETMNCSLRSRKSCRWTGLMCWTYFGSCCTVDLVDATNLRKHVVNEDHLRYFGDERQHFDAHGSRNEFRALF